MFGNRLYQCKLSAHCLSGCGYSKGRCCCKYIVYKLNFCGQMVGGGGEGKGETDNYWMCVYKINLKFQMGKMLSIKDLCVYVCMCCLCLFVNKHRTFERQTYN